MGTEKVDIDAWIKEELYNEANKIYKALWAIELLQALSKSLAKGD